jgi:hypothetical protein
VELDSHVSDRLQQPKTMDMERCLADPTDPATGKIVGYVIVLELLKFTPDALLEGNMRLWSNNYLT